MNLRDLPLDPALVTPAVRPRAHFLLAHPAHAIALGFGCGLSPVAPGTVATAWAWLAFLLMQSLLAAAMVGTVVLVTVPIGWWASTVTARNLRSPDPGPIVIDEIMSFWLVLWVFMPAGWAGQLCAFVLFRLFDTLKPGPIGWIDTLFHRYGFGWRGALGVLLDDLAAAFCTLLVLAIWRFHA